MRKVGIHPFVASDSESPPAESSLASPDRQIAGSRSPAREKNAQEPAASEAEARKIVAREAAANAAVKDGGNGCGTASCGTATVKTVAEEKDSSTVAQGGTNLRRRCETADHPQPRVLVAICTLREADNVVPMLTALRLACPSADLLVIDDDSDDGTPELAMEFARRESSSSSKTSVIIRQEKGLGGALVATMQSAIDGNYDFLVNLDADFSHDPSVVPTLIERAVTDDVDVVVGSRYAVGGRIDGWPLHRRWMSRMVNRLAVGRLGLPVSDCSGAMRCYRVEALRRLPPARLRSQGYAVLEEILLRLSEDPAVRFAEVPITFVDRHAGQSKLTVGEAVRSLVNILRLRRNVQ